MRVHQKYGVKVVQHKETRKSPYDVSSAAFCVQNSFFVFTILVEFIWLKSQFVYWLESGKQMQSNFTCNEIFPFTNHPKRQILNKRKRPVDQSDQGMLLESWYDVDLLRKKNYLCLMHITLAHKMAVILWPQKETGWFLSDANF